MLTIMSMLTSVHMATMQIASAIACFIQLSSSVQWYLITHTSTNQSDALTRRLAYLMLSSAGRGLHLPQQKLQKQQKQQHR